LVVIFDEALPLTTGESHNCDAPYRCMRRVLKTQRQKGVFLDTSAKLHSFTPEGAASDRGTGIGAFPLPMFEIDTFDAFRCTESIISVDTNDGDYFARLFTFGRPLWRMQLVHRCNGDLNELIKFACHKLARGGDKQMTDDLLCALFVCRFGLQPCEKLASAMVAHHMATLVAVSSDRKTCVSKYLSEPILAEASAFLTSHGHLKPPQVVTSVVQQLSNDLLKCDVGDRGEVAAAAMLGFAMDRLRSSGEYNAVSANMSRSVSVSEFLVSIYPKLGNESMEELSKWSINFTHFYVAPTSPSSTTLPLCWAQHAALYVPTGEEGIDLLITMLKTPSTSTEPMFATLRVQVKNYKNDISLTQAHGWLDKLGPERCAPRMAEPFSIALLLGVGKGEVASVCETRSIGRHTRSTGPRGQQLRLAVSTKEMEDADDLVGSIRELAGEACSSLTEASLHCREGVFATMVEDTGDEGSAK
jgi:hypothetical protein